ncbi:hypothetical protein C1J01_16325 [Nonomuraea aridisoli]|uniref:Uncharacterized protein n=1 Tax=Nonomuraea aridisoli TaxID=2070368 RepID=A0A2W2FSM0_9ACTN|nr:hypothetical protein C1J01_16325 [Nonomuraea aridisoli]
MGQRNLQVGQVGVAVPAVQIGQPAGPAQLLTDEVARLGNNGCFADGIVPRVHLGCVDDGRPRGRREVGQPMVQSRPQLPRAVLQERQAPAQHHQPLQVPFDLRVQAEKL